MTVPAGLLVGAAAGLSFLAVVAEGTKRQAAARAFRPAAMAAIVLLAALRPAAFPPVHRLFIVAGLALSLVGDILMMLPQKKFLAGLAAFLATHLLYSTGIWRTMVGRLEPAVALPVLVGAFFVLRILFPHLSRMKAPVTLYIVAVTIMVCLAGQRYVDLGGAPALSAISGAILFAASDIILGFNRFVKKIPSAQVFILGTYFTAQILFALSV